MKLCTFEVKTVLGRFERLGAVTPSGIVDLNSAARWVLVRRGDARPEALAAALVPADLLTFLEGGEQSMEAAKGALAAVQTEIQTGRSLKGPNDECILFDFASMKVLPPVARPRFVDERRFAGLAGPDDNLRWPVYAEKLSFEPRVAAVVGRRARNVAAQQAVSCLAGFTILNVVIASGAGRTEVLAGMGPALVTLNEFHNGNGLRAAARINGEVWMESDPLDLLQSFETEIERLTLDGTLLPGDIITRAVPGAPLADAGRVLKRGDTIETEIEPIGVLRNRIL